MPKVIPPVQSGILHAFTITLPMHGHENFSEELTGKPREWAFTMVGEPWRRIGGEAVWRDIYWCTTEMHRHNMVNNVLESEWPFAVNLDAAGTYPGSLCVCATCCVTGPSWLRSHWCQAALAVFDSLTVRLALSLFPLSDRGER